MKDIGEFKTLDGLKRYKLSLQRKINDTHKEYSQVQAYLAGIEGKEAHVCALLDRYGDTLRVAREAGVPHEAVRLIEASRRGQERRVSAMKEAHVKRMEAHVARLRKAMEQHPEWDGRPTPAAYARYAGIRPDLAARVIAAARCAK